MAEPPEAGIAESWARERELMRDAADALLARAGGAGRVRVWRQSGNDLDPSMWRAMADAGWARLLWPEAQGGLGLGMAEAAVMHHALGRHAAPDPVAAAIVLAGTVLAGCDPRGLAGRLLERLSDGELVAAVAWSERNGTIDAERPETRAVAAGNEVEITGRKRFVLPCRDVHGFVVFASAERGPALYWVPAGAGGLQVRSDRLVDEAHAGELILERVRAPADHRLSEGAPAVELVDLALDRARVAACAEMLGVMERAFEITVDYVRQRRQFGVTIGSFQSVRHRLVDLHIQIELSRVALEEAVQALDGAAAAARRREAVSAAKARIGEACLLVTRQAIQLHGAIAYTDEYDVGFYVKRALALAAWLGNARMHRARFARSRLEVAA